MPVVDALPEPGSAAWYLLQNFGSEVWLQALLWAGASPKYSATWALTFGEMIQSIHMYMQFGCAACELIIQVSDHPVAPSLGRNPSPRGLAATGWPSAFSAKYWYCQVVPTSSSPLANAEICLAASDQYSPTYGCCCFSRSTAALNCFWSSS